MHSVRIKELLLVAKLRSQPEVSLHLRRYKTMICVVNWKDWRCRGLFLGVILELNGRRPSEETHSILSIDI
jgi:hypothetical protein